ncbi:MAG TPA: glycoside hydrolase family 172 protein [Candidatus Acidoferrum sp.]|nr:glycoside hydrolase family 172 protein [Candidatus Acidoferrum sp.]
MRRLPKPNHPCLLNALFLSAALCGNWALGQAPGLQDLATLTPGRTRAENALWIETPLTARFNSSKHVVVADLKGPAVITMVHFAMPVTLKLNRDLLLRMYWDGEASPSVEAPLVDFFCDPAGLRQSVNTALVNKRRGFNAYFPMPFRKSGKIELLYDGPVPPGDELWRIMPCYSYVNYRTVKKVSADTGYFHASWRQEGLLLGKRDYLALEAKGRGKLVGWNVSVRSPGRDGYPVDENEKFYIDGESVASVEYQGLEDSFGFSWGFPESENLFPLTGYFPFMKGAAAYRFFTQDAISFEKSLRVMIGFGVNEDPSFRRDFSKPGTTLQFSTTVYWYQTEPHAPLPAMPSAVDRAPAPEEPLWPDKETLPSPEQLKARGVKLEMLCGRPGKEVIFAEKGYGATAKKGFTYSGWGLPVYHTRAGNDETEIELTVPKGASGLVRVYVIDPDNFEGGRKETVSVAGEDLGTIENFQDGKWLEHKVGADKTADGKVLMKAVNARQGSNAVISIIEWVEK